MSMLCTYFKLNSSPTPMFLTFIVINILYQLAEIIGCCFQLSLDIPIEFICVPNASDVNVIISLYFSFIIIFNIECPNDLLDYKGLFSYCRRSVLIPSRPSGCSSFVSNLLKYLNQVLTLISC